MTKARDLANAADVLDDVSATELSYVNGVTSAIQTQLNAKQAVVSGVNDTEIGYLDGVTSAIQTQIDSKIGSASAISPTLIDAKGDLIVGSAADTAARLAVGTNNHVLTADSSATNGVKWAAASSAFVGCFLYKTGNQSIANATQTVLTFENESYDTDGFHSTTSNTGRITIPSGKGGKYLIGGMVAAQEANGSKWILTKINGGSIMAVFNFPSATTVSGYNSFSNLYNLTAGDYVEVLYEQNDGNNRNVYGNTPQDTNFYCIYLGA